MRRYRAAHPGKAAEQQRKRYKVNREKEIARTKAWTQANPDYRRGWVAANPGRILVSLRKYAAKNKEKRRKDAREYSAKHRDKRRLWAISNPEKIREAGLRWDRAHKAKKLAQMRLWHATHPAQSSLRRRKGHHARRAKENGVAAAGHFTQADARLILLSQDGLCLYCSVLLPEGRGRHIDHLVPLSRGGTNHPKNISWACSRCNMKKGTMTAEEFVNVTVAA